VSIASGATFNIDTVSAHALNAGSITIGRGRDRELAQRSYRFGQRGSIDNFGLFESKVDSSISDIGSGGTFDNGGTFRKATTSGVTTFTGITFNHSGGTVDVQTGTLNLSAGTASAPFTISAARRSSSTTARTRSTPAPTPRARARSTSTAARSPSTLAARQSSTCASTRARRRHRHAQDGLTGGGWEWNGGTMSGGGTSVIENAATLLISGLSNKSLSNRTLTLQSARPRPSPAPARSTCPHGATIANAGTLTDAAGITFNDAGSDGGITNHRHLPAHGGVTTSLTNVDLINSGTIKVTTARSTLATSPTPAASS
jgi:hypothetical protein